MDGLGYDLRLVDLRELFLHEVNVVAESGYVDVFGGDEFRISVECGLQECASATEEVEKLFGVVFAATRP